MAGLAAAKEVIAAGHEAIVYEASDGPGGRVRTDVVDGYRLDRGFQIMLTAYPECQELLDYDRLDLRPFLPGASVRIDDAFHRIGDPLREPKQLGATLTAPIGSPIDKLRILSYRLKVNKGSVESLWEGVGTTAAYRFEKLGFSDRMIQRFLQPLFAGITLDADLQGSSQVVDFVFRMLSAGDAAVPAQGMGAISDQLAESLPAGTIHFGAKVERVTSSTIAISGGNAVDVDAVIVATDATESSRLADTEDPGWNGVTSVWLSSPIAPIAQPVLALNGSGFGPINSMAPMSHVSAAYAPEGSHLFVVSAPTMDADAPAAMRKHLRRSSGRPHREGTTQATPWSQRQGGSRGQRSLSCRRPSSRRFAQRCACLWPGRRSGRHRLVRRQFRLRPRNPFHPSGNVRFS